jgi:hypothetical protein
LWEKTGGKMIHAYNLHYYEAIRPEKKVYKNDLYRLMDKISETKRHINLYKRIGTPENVIAKEKEKLIQWLGI